MTAASRWRRLRTASGYGSLRSCDRRLAGKEGATAWPPGVVLQQTLQHQNEPGPKEEEDQVTFRAGLWSIDRIVLFLHVVRCQHGNAVLPLLEASAFAAHGDGSPALQVAEPGPARCLSLPGSREDRDVRRRVGRAGGSPPGVRRA